MAIMLSAKQIEEFREYLVSGRWEEDYGYRTPDGQAEMLDLLESIFELCDIADEILTKKFYKNLMGAGDDSGAQAQYEISPQGMPDKE